MIPMLSITRDIANHWSYRLGETQAIPNERGASRERGSSRRSVLCPGAHGDLSKRLEVAKTAASGVDWFSLEGWTFFSSMFFDFVYI